MNLQIASYHPQMVWRDKPFRIPQDYCPCRPTTILTGSLKKKDGVFLLHLPYETAFKSSLTPPLLEQQGRASWARRAAAPCLLRAATKREIAVGEEEERSKNLNYRGGEEQHGNRKGITTVPEQKGFPTGSPRRATYACLTRGIYCLFLK